MQQTPPNLDPLALLVVLAGLIFEPRVAEVVGPYLGILFGSTLGAYYRLGQLRSKTAEAQPRPNAFAFFLSVNTGAFLFTFVLAKAAHAWVPILESDWLLTPIALAIGLVGERWPAIGAWAAGLAKRFADAAINRKSGGDSNGA